MADTRKYPLSLYNPDGAVLQVNNDKEFETAKKKNYKPGYVKSHFPKMVYNKTTGADRLINNEDELADALAGDFTEKYVAPVAPKVEAPKEPASDDTSTVRALLAEFHDVKNRLEDAEDHIADLEASFAKLAKPEKPAKPAAGANKQPATT